jgi:hypothetical protein
MAELCNTRKILKGRIDLRSALDDALSNWSSENTASSHEMSRARTRVPVAGRQEKMNFATVQQK